MKDLVRSLPWANISLELIKLVGSVLSGTPSQGMYEVLEYDSILELLDNRGERAKFSKRQKVRYLQDNIIAYQDQAWGDGEILLKYRCSPGVPVDRYRPGQKTYILISLREVKHRGDVDEFHIQWQMRKCFPRKQEQWETEISHPTKRLVMRLIFPKDRPPFRTALIEDTRRKSTWLSESSQRQLPDGRWQVEAEIQQPILHERYSLRWEW